MSLLSTVIVIVDLLKSPFNFSAHVPHHTESLFFSDLFGGQRTRNDQVKYVLSMAKNRLSAFLRFLYESRTSGARSGGGGTSATKVETSSGNAASKYMQSAARTMSGG
jgi:hypothetical protein